ncbi:NADP-binding protein [Dacryopinax primogenitus]|uniref:NADP-binding protein n=1 Tax=Dacryopinax primogenitus (strain DJM 731) TaxID=1858805 RepID=M5GBK0_DACPD|nr:NADP-binding protein [Dacryopinax primogenitus]EJU05780.1 NADP-binding protein [Dacryopinax primogenitus]
MKVGTVYFHYLQWIPLPSVASFKQDLTGKNVIVTGSNVGLGLEAARHLARMNPAKLVLGCRDLEKAEKAKESIVKNTGCTTIECWKLDQAEFSSVTAFADRFESEVGVLDLLIANAGLSMAGEFRKTPDGYEQVLQVNHLSTALLSIRLLPCLMKATVAPPFPRLVIVSSDVHYWVYDLPEASAPNILELLGSEEHCKKDGVLGKRYSVSKLLNVFFTRSLAEHIPKTSALTVNAVNPGLCHSELTRNRKNPTWRFWFWKLVNGRSTEVGSRTLLHAALSKDMQGLTGKFTNACAVAEESDLVISPEGKVIQDRVWEETKEILEKADPKVKTVLSESLV